MSRNNNRNFDKQKYRQAVRGYNSTPFRSQPYGHAPFSVGFFAHKMHMRPTTLISAFAEAGIRGLTPNYIVDSSQWEALTTFYNSLRRSQTQEIYRDTSSLDKRIILLQDINVQLLHELAKRPQLMYDLESRKFEELVAKLLEDQGCDVTLTKRTRDGGYDLFGSMKAGPTNLIFLAECKRYAPHNKVGVEVIRGLYGVTEIQKANLGLVITTSSFTKDAQEEKLRIGPRIDLKEYSDLCAWLSAYSSVG